MNNAVSSWKTSLGGILLGLAFMFGPRISGTNPQSAPPVTIENLAKGAAAIWLGLSAKDNNKTNSPNPVPTQDNKS